MKSRKESSSMNTTWHGREFLTAGVAPIMAMAAVLLCLLLMMLTWPIWVPLDWVLKRFGLRGFIIALGNGRHGLEFRPEAFSRRRSA